MQSLVGRLCRVFVLYTSCASALYVCPTFVDNKRSGQRHSAAVCRSTQLGGNVLGLSNAALQWYQTATGQNAFQAVAEHQVITMFAFQKVTTCHA